MKIFLRNLSKLVYEKLEFIRCSKRTQKICILNFLLCLKVLIIGLYFPNKTVLGVELLTNEYYGYSPVVTGYRNKALADYSSAMGNGNTARGKLSVSVGTDNISGWGELVVLPELDPFLISTDKKNTFSIGQQLNKKYIIDTEQRSMIAFGVKNVSVGEKSISIGIANFSSSPYSIAIGKSNFASARTSQAIGDWNTVKGIESNAIGYGNVILDDARLSSAVGIFNYINTAQSYAFGGRNTINSNFSNSVGFENEIRGNASYSNIFGSKNTILAKSSLALGIGNIVSGHHSISIGNGDMETSDSTVINGSSVSGHHAVSVGHKNKVNSSNTIAIGNFIDSNNVSNSVILGTNSLGEPVTPTDSIVKIPFGGVLGDLEISKRWSGISVVGNGSISVGKRGHERQIKNVATGEISENSTDAINGSQLFSAIDAIGRVALKIGGDSTVSYTDKRLGDTLHLKGGSLEELSENNLGVLVEDNQISIKLAKNLSNLGAIKFDGGTILNNTGLFLINGPRISVDEIDANQKPIKNVYITEKSAAGDAVNKGYVDKLIMTQSNSQLTIESNNGKFSKKFTDPIFILGTSEEVRKLEYDSNNVITWIDNEKLRVGTKKNFVIKTLTATDEMNKSIEISSDSIIFKKLTNNNENQNYVIKILNIGLNNIKGENIARITLNGSVVASTKDGFKLLANNGEGVPLELNKSISFLGNNYNLNKDYFDDGGNISTKIETTQDGAELSIAFKRSPEFESLTLNGSQTDSPQLILKDHSRSKKISLNIDNGNGEVTVFSNLPNKYSSLTYDGLYLNDQLGYSKLAFKDDGTGSVDSLDFNKRRLTHSLDYKGEMKTEEIATLEDGLIFNGNVRSGNGATKLNKTVNISGADANTNWNDFDEGKNIMTKVETKNGETVIRIAMRKDLKLKNGSFGGDGTTGELKLKDRNGKDGLTLNPDRITFNNITKLDENGNPQKNGSAGLSMTQNGKSDLVKEGPATRILITDSKGKSISEVATMNDGLKFGANTGDEVSNLLNSKVIVAGNKQNNDWTKFDEGKNIMTKVEQNKEGQTDITIALKRDIELDSATFGHGATTEQNGLKPKEGKDGRIKLVNKDGKTTIQIDAGKTNDSNGPAISINKPDSEEGSKLTSEGFEIRKKSHKTKSESKALSKTTNAFVSIAPEGSARIEQDASQSRPRLTLKSGEGESAITEEIATMNDGLRFRGDSEELINKTLSSTLSIVGGETDATKLTLTKEDKNIGVIVEDSPRAAKDKDTKSQKVLAVRLSKNLKGLQSAEFKPVDENGKPTGQTITIGKEGLTFSNKDKKSQFNEEGLKIGENGPSVTDKGINAGGMNISNVAPPTQPHHASTRGYVDTQVRHLESKINERYKDALGASAMAMATALLPSANIPGKGGFSVSGAVVAGQPAYALGVSIISESNKLILKGAVSSDVRGQVGGGVGALYHW